MRGWQRKFYASSFTSREINEDSLGNPFMRERVKVGDNRELGKESVGGSGEI